MRTLTAPSSSRSRDTVAWVATTPSAARRSTTWVWLVTAWLSSIRAMRCWRWGLANLMPRRPPRLHPAQRGTQQQGTTDVVAVAHVGDDPAFEAAEPLPERQQVGQGLTGMRRIGKEVHDRHPRGAGQALHLVVFEDPGAD